jgi:hypothetical protein
MTPLPDRVVLIGLIATIGLCFALVLWTVKLQPGPEQRLQWRDSPALPAQPQQRNPAGTGGPFL